MITQVDQDTGRELIYPSIGLLAGTVAEAIPVTRAVGEVGTKRKATPTKRSARGTEAVSRSRRTSSNLAGAGEGSTGGRSGGRSNRPGLGGSWGCYDALGGQFGFTKLLAQGFCTGWGLVWRDRLVRWLQNRFIDRLHRGCSDRGRDIVRCNLSRRSDRVRCLLSRRTNETGGKQENREDRAFDFTFPHFRFQLLHCKGPAAFSQLPDSSGHSEDTGRLLWGEGRGEGELAHAVSNLERAVDQPQRAQRTQGENLGKRWSSPDM